MLVRVVTHVAGLAERCQIARAVVAGVVIEVRAGQHHARPAERQGRRDAGEALGACAAQRAKKNRFRLVVRMVPRGDFRARTFQCSMKQEIIASFSRIHFKGAASESRGRESGRPTEAARNRE